MALCKARTEQNIQNTFIYKFDVILTVHPR